MTVLARLFGRSTKGGNAVSAFSQAQWTPTHRHRKGGLYRRITTGVLETDRSDVVIYDDAEGTVWVRPTAEFDDGRFTPL